MEHGVCQKMIRENWTVFTETSWEKLLGSSGHKISNEKLYIRSQEQNHFQLQSQKGDWSCLDTFWDFQMTVLQEKLWDIILRRGTRRTTIVTTLNENIKRTRENDNTFRVTPLISQISLQNIYTKAKNRKFWSKIVKQVVNWPCFIVIGSRKGKEEEERIVHLVFMMFAERKLVSFFLFYASSS